MCSSVRVPKDCQDATLLILQLQVDVGEWVNNLQIWQFSKNEGRQSMLIFLFEPEV